MKQVILVIFAACSLLGCATSQSSERMVAETKEMNMPEKIIKKHACIPEAEFEDVNLSGSRFSNVNLSGSTFHGINFSDATFSAANFSNVKFLHIGPAPDESGQHPKQTPVSFKESDFNGSTFEDVDLSNVRISKCTIDGMTIEGIPVEEMIRAYKEKHGELKRLP